MSRAILRSLPTIANVGAGNKVVLHCPVGPTYESVTLVQGGTSFTRAHLTNISVMVNGKEIQRYADGDELDALNDYYGRSDTANYLTLHFSRPELVELAMRRLPAIGTADVTSFTIEADIAAGASAPTLTASALVRAPEPLGLITKVKRFPVTYSTSGQQSIDSLVRGPRIGALHLKKSDVSAVKVEVDGVTVWDATKTLGEVKQKEAGRTPQTAAYSHVDFLLDNDIASALVTSQRQDLRVLPTLGSSGALVAIVEYLDEWAGI